MKTSQAGIDLIKSFEGLELEAYPDPGTGAEPITIGYGHTGPEVHLGMVIDETVAESLLRRDLAKFEECVAAALQVEVTQHQFDALVAFAFNVGCNALRGSTLLKLLNAGDAEAAMLQFQRWNRAGGRVLAGLTRRRAAEADLFGAA